MFDENTLMDAAKTRQTVFFYSRSERSLMSEGGQLVMTNVSLAQAVSNYGVGEFNCVVRCIP